MWFDEENLNEPTCSCCWCIPADHQWAVCISYRNVEQYQLLHLLCNKTYLAHRFICRVISTLSQQMGCVLFCEAKRPRCELESRSWAILCWSSCLKREEEAYPLELQGIWCGDDTYSTDSEFLSSCLFRPSAASSSVGTGSSGTGFPVTISCLATTQHSAGI